MKRLASVLWVLALALAACSGKGGTTIAAVPAPPPAPGFVGPPQSIYVASPDMINVFPASGGAMQRQINWPSKYSAGVLGSGGLGSMSDAIGEAKVMSDGTLIVLQHSYRHIFDIWTSVFAVSAGASDPPAHAFYASGWGNLSAVAFFPGTRAFATIGLNKGEVHVFPAPGAEPKRITTDYDVERFAGLAVDASGSIYASELRSGVIAVYDAKAMQDPNGHPTPVRTLAASRWPWVLAFGPDGTLYAITSEDYARDRILEFAPGAGEPARALGPFAQAFVADIAIDRQNQLFVALNHFDGHNSVRVFGPGATDSNAPLRTFVDPIPLGDGYPLPGRWPPGEHIRSISIGP